MNALPISIHVGMMLFVLSMPLAILLSVVVFAGLRTCGLSWRALASLGTISRWSMLAPIPLIIWYEGSFDMGAWWTIWFLFLLFLSLGAMGEWAQETADSSESPAVVRPVPSRAKRAPLIAQLQSMQPQESLKFPMEATTYWVYSVGHE